jgi:hypothetical protein
LWLRDPATATHGESITNLIRRVGEWLGCEQARDQRGIVVAQPAVIRVAIVHAIEAAPQSFWRIDISPLSITPEWQTVFVHKFSADMTPSSSCPKRRSYFRIQHLAGLKSPASIPFTSHNRDLTIRCDAHVADVVAPNQSVQLTGDFQSAIF